VNLPVLLAGLAGFLSDSVESESRLRDLRWSARQDTLRIEFDFEGARPARFRVANPAGGGGKPGLGVDFEGVRWRKRSGGLPTWIHGGPTADSSGLSVRIDLRRPSVWRAVWSGDILALEMVGRPRPALWADPRALGVAGVGLAAGATAIWLASQEESKPVKPPATDDGIIPPPDFGFPR